MNMMMDLEISKSGRKCLWESGGGMTNTGKSRIIAGSKGERKRALFVRSKGELSNSVHALIPVREEDVVVDCYRNKAGFEIDIYKITEIIDNQAKVERIAELREGKWNADVSMYKEAIEASMRKSRMYHCREAIFIE